MIIMKLEIRRVVLQSDERALLLNQINVAHCNVHPVHSPSLAVPLTSRPNRYPILNPILELYRPKIFLPVSFRVLCVTEQ